MRDNRRRAITLTSALTCVQASVVLLATRTMAAPSPGPSAPPSNDPCALIRGPAQAICERGNTAGGSGGAPAPTSTGLPSSLDPLDSLAKGCADAAA
jgi:hypothetical protein